MFLVTGGTGTLGRLVVPQLLQAGGKVRVLSRREHEPAEGIEYAVGDLDTGAGIDAGLFGVPGHIGCEYEFGVGFHFCEEVGEKRSVVPAQIAVFGFVIGIWIENKDSI